MKHACRKQLSAVTSRVLGRLVPTVMHPGVLCEYQSSHEQRKMFEPKTSVLYWKLNSYILLFFPHLRYKKFAISSLLRPWKKIRKQDLLQVTDPAITRERTKCCSKWTQLGMIQKAKLAVMVKKIMLHCRWSCFIILDLTILFLKILRRDYRVNTSLFLSLFWSLLLTSARLQSFFYLCGSL